MFWNPQDVQIPKLSLEFQFDQDLIEKTRKHLDAFLMISTVEENFEFALKINKSFGSNVYRNCHLAS